MSISRDYTKEVGISSPKKTMPRPLAFAILALVAVGVFFGISEVKKREKSHHAEKSAPAAASP